MTDIHRDSRYIAAFRYLLALLGRLLPVYYRLGLLLLMVPLDAILETDTGIGLLLSFATSYHYKIIWLWVSVNC